MTDPREMRLDELVAARNEAKRLFTAGPASLLPENLAGLRPCFGRGDADYDAVEAGVLEALRGMSGHSRIARLQGSASLALEIMGLNFLTGRVLVIRSGYYSERLHALAESCMRRTGRVTEVNAADHAALEAVTGRFDWVVACSTETSRGIRVPIEELAALARRLGARLMLDATASIGLEDQHDLADVIGYSSCKGLFGLTGAAFIAFNEQPEAEVDSFYLNLATHLEKRVTGPYHAIASLAEVLPRHAEFRASVVTNKARLLREMAAHLTVPPERQPLLCTHVDCGIEALDPRVVLYHPRGSAGGSVVCHLGEVHLGRSAEGAILESIRVAPSPEKGA